MKKRKEERKKKREEKTKKINVVFFSNLLMSKYAFSYFSLFFFFFFVSLSSPSSSCLEDRERIGYRTMRNENVGLNRWKKIFSSRILACGLVFKKNENENKKSKNACFLCCVSRSCS